MIERKREEEQVAVIADKMMIRARKYDYFINAKFMLTSRVDLIYHAMRKIENYKSAEKEFLVMIMIISAMLATFQTDNKKKRNENEKMKIVNAKGTLSCLILFLLI